LNLPSPPTQENPLDFQWIKRHQDDDEILYHMRKGLPHAYHLRTFDKIDLVCHINPNEDADTQWKICLTKKTLIPTIRWFHQVLNHPGQTRLHDAINTRYYHPQLRHEVNNFACDACQKYKLSGTGYGLLPPRESHVQPFYEVAVDLIGPWKMTIGNNEYEFNALTSIDTATNLVEMICIDEKTSEHVRN